MFNWFWKSYLKLKGWKVDAFPSDIPKCVIVVGPHTSNEDFILGLALRSVYDLKGTKFLAKAELFNGPFGFLFHQLGGIPVNRAQNNNLVDQVVKEFNKYPFFRLAISPEGTRKKVSKLKTGFYQIAQKANVPIVMVGFDFANKHAICSAPFYITNNEVADFHLIIDFFIPVKGKFPENGISSY